MTEEDLGKLKFRECSRITLKTEYHTFYECVSDPLAGRLFVNCIVRRDERTGNSLGRGRIHYSLDGKVYKSKEKLMEMLKTFET